MENTINLSQSTNRLKITKKLQTEPKPPKMGYKTLRTMSFSAVTTYKKL